jgi:hypothetical protein
MKAKKKPLDTKTPEGFGVDVAPRLKVLKTAEPPARKAGVKVADVAELIDKLKNEAGDLMSHAPLRRTRQRHAEGRDAEGAHRRPRWAPKSMSWSPATAAARWPRPPPDRRRRQGAARRSAHYAHAWPSRRGADRLARRPLRRHRRSRPPPPPARTSCRASPRCST